MERSTSLQATIDASQQQSAKHSTRIAHMLAGFIAVLLRSVPLGKLSRSALSSIMLVVTALLNLAQHVRDQIRTDAVVEESHEMLELVDAYGTRHKIAFLGDKAVGKSSLIRALRPHVPSHFRVVSGLEGENAAAHEQRVRSHMVIVWTSQLPETMKVYTARYRASMPSTTSTIAVSNMTDVAPCPLPEMNAMRGTRVPALAVSAARGTNVGALWILIERSMRAVPGAPLGTPFAAPSLELQQTRTPRPGLAETYRAASPPPTRQSRRDEMPSPLSIIPSAGEASSLGGEGGSPSRGDTANFVRPATSFVKREEEERGSADALKHVHGRDREASPLARREQVRSRVVMAA